MLGGLCQEPGEILIFFYYLTNAIYIPAISPEYITVPGTEHRTKYIYFLNKWKTSPKIFFTHCFPQSNSLQSSGVFLSDSQLRTSDICTQTLPAEHEEVGMPVAWNTLWRWPLEWQGLGPALSQSCTPSFLGSPLLPVSSKNLGTEIEITFCFIQALHHLQPISTQTARR